MATAVNFSSEQHCYLALASVFPVKPAIWLGLLNQTGLPVQAFFDERVGLFQAVCEPQQYTMLCQALKNINERRIIEALNWQQKCANNRLLTCADAAYPEGFKSLDSPPLVLFVKGNSASLAMPQVAIVGSRRASHSGQFHAHQFAGQLSQQGLAITSGMALGIDAKAHYGAIDARGITIAVTGTGPDRTYPSRNRQLEADIIAAGGAVVTEFFPGEAPRRANFPRRNRLIAALSLGTLVIEATIRSGTLITANLAADMGRDVFVIPGNIDNPLSAGCHHLIRQGAVLTTSYKDILQELGLTEMHNTQITRHRDEKSQDESLATDQILASVNYDVTSVDIITERSNLPVSEVLAQLLQYELRGLVTAVPGGYVKLRGK